MSPSSLPLLSPFPIGLFLHRQSVSQILSSQSSSYHFSLTHSLSSETWSCLALPDFLWRRLIRTHRATFLSRSVLLASLVTRDGDQANTHTHTFAADAVIGLVNWHCSKEGSKVQFRPAAAVLLVGLLLHHRQPHPKTVGLFIFLCCFLFIIIMCLCFPSHRRRKDHQCALVYLNWAGHFLIIRERTIHWHCLPVYLIPHQTSAATSEEGATDLVVVVKPSFEDFHGLLSAICLHHFFVGCMATSFNIGHHWHLFCWTSFQTGWCVYQHWLASSTVCWYEYHRLSLAVDCDSQLTHSSCCCRTLVTCLIGCNSVPLSLS